MWVLGGRVGLQAGKWRRSGLPKRCALCMAMAGRQFGSTTRGL